MRYRPNELIAFLQELGIRPNKRLSQNFLVDGNIVRKILSAAELEAGDVVLEIGPGAAVLTEGLLESGANVIAVEKDPVLAKALHQLPLSKGTLEVFNEDIMTFPLEEILKQRCQNGKKAKVVANLPYHLTTPILTRLITQEDLFSRLVVMVQDEVAERFTANHGNKHYSSFTVFLKFYSNPHYAFTVSSQCFYPKPSVDSAVVVITPKIPPLQGDDQEKFFKITRTAFEHRRKMMRASLKNIYPSGIIEKALEEIGSHACARPEELSLADFLSFFHQLNRETK